MVMVLLWDGSYDRSMVMVILRDGSYDGLYCDGLHGDRLSWTNQRVCSAPLIILYIITTLRGTCSLHNKP